MTGIISFIIYAPACIIPKCLAELLKRKDEFANNKAIVFDGIHYLHIFFYLLNKRYDKLADNLVNINNMFSSREEAISNDEGKNKKNLDPVLMFESRESKSETLIS